MKYLNTYTFLLWGMLSMSMQLDSAYVPRDDRLLPYSVTRYRFSLLTGAYNHTPGGGVGGSHGFK